MSRKIIVIIYVILQYMSLAHAVPTEVHYFSAPTSIDAKELCNNFAASLGYPNACGGGGDGDAYYWAVAGYLATPVGATGDDVERYDSVHVTVRPEEDEDECGVGNPILPSNGYKIQDEIVYQGNGILPLRISLHYSSMPSEDFLTRWRWRLGNTYAVTSRICSWKGHS